MLVVLSTETLSRLERLCLLQPLSKPGCVICVIGKKSYLCRWKCKVFADNGRNEIV